MPLCQSSSVSSRIGARGPWPALLTSASMRPHFAIARVDQALEIVVRPVGAGDADAAELFGQRLALAGRREDGDLVAVLRELARRVRAHAAAARRDDRDLRIRHDCLLVCPCVHRRREPLRQRLAICGQPPLIRGPRPRRCPPLTRRAAMTEDNADAAREERRVTWSGFVAARLFDRHLPDRRDRRQAMGAGANLGKLLLTLALYSAGNLVMLRLVRDFGMASAFSLSAVIQLVAVNVIALAWFGERLNACRAAASCWRSSPSG